MNKTLAKAVTHREFLKMIGLAVVGAGAGQVAAPPRSAFAEQFNDLTVLGNTFLATTSGNVGIGTINPQSLLHVDNSASPTVVIGGYNTNVKTVELRNYGSVVGNESFCIRANSNIFAFEKPGSAGSDYVRFDFAPVGSVNSLNPFWAGLHMGSQMITVGGGNTYPRTSFHYSYTSTADPTDLTFNIATGNTSVKQDIRIASSSNGSILLTPDGTGRVGIGTTSPQEKLEVAGNLRVNGEVRVNGVTAIRSDGVAAQSYYT